MFSFFRRKRPTDELDTLITEMKQYLENNYKSLAHEARKKLGERTEQLYAEGKITQEEYRKYEAVYVEYTNKLKYYRH